MRQHAEVDRVMIHKMPIHPWDPERRESDEQFRELMAHLQQVFWIENAADDAVLYISPAYARVWGRSGESLRENFQTFLSAIHPEDRERVTGVMAAKRETRGYELEYRILLPDGTVRWIWARSYPVCDGQGRIRRFAGIAEDVTERKNLEAQFRQSQKLEGMGRLAVGLAHDLNNLITVISGYSEMLLAEIPSGNGARTWLTEIRSAGDRAAALTRQLMGFSRKQMLELRVVDLNAVVAKSEPMLRQLVGEGVDMGIIRGPGLGRVRTDAGQMEQVLMNLVINARDAMPLGGKLTLETANVVLDASSGRSRTEVKPGRYVMLAVSDSGSGMDVQTQCRIFEPFFTTKPDGHGTGLGLAMVQGFVTQIGGYVCVDSQPGLGSTFKIYLPEVSDDLSLAPRPPAVQGVSRGDETILLVEDEAAVRAFVRRALQSCGYTVLEASHGDEAVRVVKTHPGSIHLLVSDVVMPGIGGRQLAGMVLALIPGVKVLFLSGYADGAVERYGILPAGISFLQKPFTMIALARHVRDVLDRDPASTAPSFPSATGHPPE